MNHKNVSFTSVNQITVPQILEDYFERAIDSVLSFFNVRNSALCSVEIGAENVPRYNPVGLGSSPSTNNITLSQSNNVSSDLKDVMHFIYEFIHEFVHHIQHHYLNKNIFAPNPNLDRAGYWLFPTEIEARFVTNHIIRNVFNWHEYATKMDIKNFCKEGSF